MINVNNIHFSYNKTTHALKGVSFDIPKGQWVSIIGHNGSGKSTLSKLLNGLLIATSGEITIDGEKLKEDTVSNIRKKVGIVFQNPDNQFIGVTVKHDIAFGLENRRVERDEMLKLIDEYARKVEMEDFLAAEPHLLSGGQKQRVAIAGVLAVNPSIIIFDEATSMLDPEGTKEIIDLISQLKKEKTIITITHDLNLAFKSDRILVLNEGKLLFDGTPEETFKEVEMLQSAKLDIPFNQKLYAAITKNEKLKNDERLVEAVWELSLKK